jgi:ABC-type amino acid transport substrate-binding protein
LVAAANATYKSTALTVSGRALTKHPNVLGFSSGEQLSAAFRSPQALNDAANKAISDIIASGTRVTRNHDRFGSIIDYTLSSGIGARFSSNFEFITFLGR